MGFELKYIFREKQEDGSFSEELKEKTVKVGTAHEDTPMEHAASKIIAQLARRNILLEDVEVHEYTKKKLSFRMTDDAIYIKNRKFKFDDGPVVEGQAECEAEQSPQEQLAALLAANPNLIQSLTGNVPQPQALPQQPQNNGIQAGVSSRGVGEGANPPHAAVQPKLGKPLRQEIFNPVNKELIQEAKNRGFNFTLGKKYPIFAEKPAPGGVMAGMNYTVIDDDGHKRILNDKHFTPDINLSKGFEEEFKPAAGARAGADPKLDWGSGIVEDDIPDIR